MRSMTFVVDDVVDTQITITEIGAGQLRFDLKVLGGVIGDLRALYLDLAGAVAAGSLTATAIDSMTGQPLPQGASLITGVVSGEASVTTMGGDTNMNGEVIKELGRFDLGIAFGTKAVIGDDIRDASFLLSGPGLTLDMLAHQDLGLRITSVGLEGGSRTAALKIGDETSGVAQLDALAVTENASQASTGNLLSNDGTAGVNTVSSARWNDGSAFTKLATGALTSALTVGGKAFGTITINPDGTFTLYAAGADIDSLALNETLGFAFTYTSLAPDGSTATATATVTITGTNDAPEVSGPVTGAVVEDGAVVVLDALARAYDKDLKDQLQVVNLPLSRELPDGVSYDAATRSFSFDPTALQWQSLAAGETRTVTVNYGVSDGKVTTPASVSWTITGTNDAPVVDGPVSGAAVEDGAVVVLDALAQASDPDSGSNLQVVGVPPGMELPDGVSYSATTRSFRLNPAAYQWLAEGETTTVTVSYGISDGLAITPASVSWTLTGRNDAPEVNGAVTGTAIEDGEAVVLDALGRAYDEDLADRLQVVNLPPDREYADGVSFDPVTQTFRLDPTPFQWQGLAAGESTTVTVNYGVSDGSAVVPASVSWTVFGVNDAPEVDGPVKGTATEDGDVVALHALAEASDPDHRDTLRVVDVPPGMELPNGVSYVASTQTFRLNPAAYQWLAEGESTKVTVNYGVSDGRVTTPTSVSWTITGRNDAPEVNGSVTGTAAEDGEVVVLDALGRAYDEDRADQLRVVNPPPSRELPDGVSFDAATQSFRLDPTASQWQRLAAGETTTVTVSYGVSDGKVTTPALVSWTITGRNDAPVVDGPVRGAAIEDGAIVTLDALSEAWDPDHSNTLQVVNVPPKMGLPEGVSYDAATRSFHFDPSGYQWQELGAGETTVVTVNYGVSDGTLITPASVSWTVTGSNDAPVVVRPVTGTAVEDGAVAVLDALGWAYDADRNDQLRVVNLPPAQELPGGVSFDAATQAFRLDPSAPQWQRLAAGETTTATVRYGISDGKVTTTALVSWTITGRNDAPVVGGPVTGTATEDGKIVVLNALAQASDPDNGNTLSVVNVPPKMGLPEGVSFNSATQSFVFDPSGLQWQELAAGQTTVVTVNYGVSDGTAITPASVSWTLTGKNDAPRAQAGTFYEVAEGNNLQLRGSGYDPDAGDSFVFAWDLNGDNEVDATGESPIISAEKLRSLGLPLDTDLTIRLIVTDSLGAEYQDAAKLVIRSTADDLMA